VSSPLLRSLEGSSFEWRTDQTWKTSCNLRMRKLFRWMGVRWLSDMGPMTVGRSCIPTYRCLRTRCEGLRRGYEYWVLQLKTKLIPTLETSRKPVTSVSVLRSTLTWVSNTTQVSVFSVWTCKFMTWLY